MIWAKRYLADPIRLLFGEDVFISYSRADGMAYAGGLAAALTAKGLACRVDLWETAPGGELPRPQRLALLRSRMLALVATPGAAASRHVLDEVTTFLETGGHVIPIDLGGITHDAGWSAHIVGLPISFETSPLALRSGHPSEEVVARIANAGTFVRRNRRLQYAAGAAVTVLLGAGVLSTQLTVSAAKAVNTAKAAETARATAMAQASVAGTAALKAQESANRAREDAIRQEEKATKAEQEAANATQLAEAQRRLADIRRREATAMSLNAAVMDPRLAGSSWARSRALQAIAAYRVAPNPLSGQLLGEALTGANHYVRRFRLADELPVVSENGLQVATWNRKSGEISVYRLGEKLDLLWRMQVEFPAGVQALGVSNDGRHVALNLQTRDKRLLLVLRGEGAPGSPGTGREIFRDTPASDRSLVFDDLRFSPDGRYFTGRQAVMGIDHPTIPTPMIYEMGEEVKRLTVPLRAGDEVDDLCISRDSQFLAVRTSRESTFEPEESRVLVYQLPDGALIKSLPAHSQYGTVSFTLDNALLLAGDEDHAGLYEIIKDWRTDAPKRETLGEDLAGEAGVDHFVFVPDTPFVGMFRYLGVDTPPTSRNARSFGTVIDDVAGYPKIVGHIANRQADIDSLVNKGDITSAGALAGEGRLVTTDIGGAVTVWDATTRYGAPTFRFKDQVTSLHVPTEGSHILVSELAFAAEEKGPGRPSKTRVYAINQWDTSQPRVTLRLEVPFTQVSAISGDGRWWAAAVTSGETEEPGLKTVQLFSLAGEPSRQYRIDLGESDLFSLNGLASLAFSPDNTALVAVTEIGTVIVWDLRQPSPDPVAVFTIHNRWESEHLLGFSRDGRTLIAAFGTTVTLWRGWRNGKAVRTGVLTATHINDSETASVAAISISAHDRYLAIGTGDGIVDIWSHWQTKRPTLQREVNMPINFAFNQPARVMDLAFHPQREDVLSVLNRIDLLVMDVATGDLFQSVPRPSGQGGAEVRFSADGRYVISSVYNDNDYVYWLWNPEDMIGEACSSFLLPEQLEDTREHVCGPTEQRR